MTQPSDTSTSGNINRRARDWIMTIWNPAHLGKLIKDTHEYLLIGAEETCPDTQRKHNHVVIYFKNARAFSALNNKYPGSWLHAKNGTYEQAKTYAAKEGIYYEHGDLPNENGTNQICMLIEEHDTLKSLMENAPEPYCKYRNGLKDIYAAKEAKKRYFEKPLVTYSWGKTGCGKTKPYFENGYVPVTYNNGFFSDWGDARAIVIEEFRGGIPYAELLKLCDGYHNYYNVNIKNGQKLIDLDFIGFTSPEAPEHWYRNMQCSEGDKLEQWLRRIDVIERYT